MEEERDPVNDSESGNNNKEKKKGKKNKNKKYKNKSEKKEGGESIKQAEIVVHEQAADEVVVPEQAAEEPVKVDEVVAPEQAADPVKVDEVVVPEQVAEEPVKVDEVVVPKKPKKEKDREKKDNFQESDLNPSLPEIVEPKKENKSKKSRDLLSSFVSSASSSKSSEPPTEKTALLSSSSSRSEGGTMGGRHASSLRRASLAVHLSKFDSLSCAPASSCANVEPLFDEVKATHGHVSTEYNSKLRWLINGVIGFFCGLTSFFLKQCIGYLFEVHEDLIAFITNEDSKQEVEPQSFLFSLWCTLLLFAVFLVTASAAIIIYVEPHAAGSGIPETCAFLNGILIPKTFTVSVLFAKFSSCMMAVGSGLPVGPEGPMIHMGSVIGSVVSQGAIFPSFIADKLVGFKNVSDRRDFMAAGVAGGVSAAFGAPIGGLLFVGEEIATKWDINIAMQVFVCSIVATTTVEFLTSSFEAFHYKGQFGVIQEASAIIFDVNTTVSVNIKMFIPVIVVGIVGGLLGCLFNYICLNATSWRGKNIKPYKIRFLFEPAVLALVFITLAVTIPSFFSCVPMDCTDSDEEGCTRVGLAPINKDDVIRYGCGADAYNPSASLTMRAGEHIVRQLFSRGFQYQFDYLPLIAMLCLYLPASAYANGIACSTGIIIPCLLNGALIGRIVGLVVTDLLGVHPTADDAWIDPGAFALIGAAAFTAGVSRLTVSLTVIMVEISNDTHFILPIMTAVMVAKWAADWTGAHPIYHALMAKKNLPYLNVNPHTHAPLEVFVAGQVAASPVICIPMKVKVPELAQILRNHSHNAFPVTCDGTFGSGDQGQFVGLVRREHLVGIIKSPNLWTDTSSKGKGLWRKLKTNILPSLNNNELAVHEMLAFDDPDALSSGLDGELMALSTRHNEKYTIDLKPYVDVSAFAVPETLSLARTYDLFRNMGLRHLTVVDRFNCVAGIITRHNLLESNLDDCVTADNMKHPKEIVEHLLAASS
jgi:chloride channel 7